LPRWLPFRQLFSFLLLNNLPDEFLFYSDFIQSVGSQIRKISKPSILGIVSKVILLQVKIRIFRRENHDSTKPFQQGILQISTALLRRAPTWQGQ